VLTVKKCYRLSFCVATRGEIFSLKFGKLPPYELEGGRVSWVVT